MFFLLTKNMRIMGFEPIHFAWKANHLPFNIYPHTNLIKNDKNLINHIH